MCLRVLSGQTNVCGAYENCDKSNALASITLPYRLGFLFFPNSLMTRRMFSILALKLSFMREASKVDEKKRKEKRNTTCAVN